MRMLCTVGLCAVARDTREMTKTCVPSPFHVIPPSHGRLVLSTPVRKASRFFERIISRRRQTDNETTAITGTHLAAPSICTYSHVISPAPSANTREKGTDETPTRPSFTTPGFGRLGGTVWKTVSVCSPDWGQKLRRPLGGST